MAYGCKLFPLQDAIRSHNDMMTGNHDTLGTMTLPRRLNWQQLLDPWLL